MKLTGAAILVSRGMRVLQAAPAAYPYRSPTKVSRHEEPRAIPGCRDPDRGGMQLERLEAD